MIDFTEWLTQRPPPKPEDLVHWISPRRIKQVSEEISRQTQNMSRDQKIKDLRELLDRANDAGDKDLSGLLHIKLKELGYAIFT